MSKGIKVAKENKDVQKASSDELYLSTDTPLLKLYKSDSGSQAFIGSGSAESYTITIPHLLGYIPVVLMFADRSPSSQRRVVMAVESNIGNTSISAGMVVNDSSIILTLSAFPNTALPGVYGYNYFIYYDKVNR